ncbi:MAG TPA: hypothetical protein VFL83_11295 [Anaeromyxobacter sp.]|nr:hypothetical protein [Anaeromyxobacter sp.]
MPRVYLPLLPLPALAVLVAVSACSKPRTEEVSHVVPPPTFAAVFAEPKPAVPATPAAAPAPADAPKDEAPSAEEVKAFEKPVRK